MWKFQSTTFVKEILWDFLSPMAKLDLVVGSFRWRIRYLAYSLHTCINYLLSPPALQCQFGIVFSTPPLTLYIPLSLYLFLHPVSYDGPLITSADGSPAGCTGRQGFIHTIINTHTFSGNESVHGNKSKITVPSGGCTVLEHIDCKKTSHGHVCCDIDLKWHWPGVIFCILLHFKANVISGV